MDNSNDRNTHLDKNHLANDKVFVKCNACTNTLEGCACVCHFCGERDKCECVLFDAATGG